MNLHLSSACHLTPYSTTVQETIFRIFKNHMTCQEVFEFILICQSVKNIKIVMDIYLVSTSRKNGPIVHRSHHAFVSLKGNRGNECPTYGTLGCSCNRILLWISHRSIVQFFSPIEREIYESLEGSNKENTFFLWKVVISRWKSVVNGHLWSPVPLAHVIELLALELSLPALTT